MISLTSSSNRQQRPAAAVSNVVYRPPLGPTRPRSTPRMTARDGTTVTGVVIAVTKWGQLITLLQPVLSSKRSLHPQTRTINDPPPGLKRVNIGHETGSGVTHTGRNWNQWLKHAVIRLSCSLLVPCLHSCRMLLSSASNWTCNFVNCRSARELFRLYTATTMTMSRINVPPHAAATITTVHWSSPSDCSQSNFWYFSWPSLNTTLPTVTWLHPNTHPF